MNVPDTLIVFSTRFLESFIEAAPFLLLGTLISGLLDAFISRDDLRRYAPRHPVPAVLVGGLLGLVFPVGAYGVVPITRRLFHKGLSLPAGIAFLLAGPVVNPVVIASTYAALHQRAPELVYLRGVVALGVAVIIGLIFSLQPRPERTLRGDIPPAPDAPSPAGHDQSSRMALAPGLRHALRLAGTESVEMGRCLILGAALAASLQMVVSQGELKALATNPVNAVPVMQGLAVLRSVGSIADAATARSLLDTFAPGSILAFLTFGPVFNLKSTLLLLTVLRRRAVLTLIVLALLLTALAAITINLNVRL